LPLLLNTPPKPFSWSFSAIDNFGTCARKYHRQNILKDVSDQTTYRSEGQEVHRFMNDRLMHAKPLPAHAARWERWIDEFLTDCDRTKVLLRGESKYAITAGFEPCGYFDKVKKVWCRVVIDALKINNDYAKIWDWKTGRIKPDTDQLMLYATVIFAHYPEVKQVEAGLIFLKEDMGAHVPRNDCTHELLIRRADLPEFWERYIHKVDALERSFLTNSWPPNPSGLCRNHCPVHDCEHNGHHT